LYEEKSGNPGDEKLRLHLKTRFLAGKKLNHNEIVERHAAN
jgi:hypothetical protein